MHGMSGIRYKKGLEILTVFERNTFSDRYRIVTVNLRKTPYLKLTSADVNGIWYLEVSGGALHTPVKIQKDTDASKESEYDLRVELGLTGKQSFELHFGVGSGTKELNLGKQTVFRNIRFVSSIGVTPSALATAV